MALRYFLAAIHILTLGVGFYGIWARGDALKNLKDKSGLPQVFKTDNIWGIAALLWIITGIWRAFGGIEKGTAYYLGCDLFLIKMGLFLVVFLIEIKPMVTLIRWRIRIRKGDSIDFSPAHKMAIKSYIELCLLIVIVFLAVAMARGYCY